MFKLGCAVALGAITAPTPNVRTMLVFMALYFVAINVSVVVARRCMRRGAPTLK
jgi:cytochrome bd-type quinol oxidase subunit 1